jgi:CBS domain containing-hemolysin-like protein
MVTHEDIAEEVVGEIQTRDQSEDELMSELGRGRYVLSAKMDIEYFMRRFKVAIEKKGFETLSGFVAYRMGKIPKKGDRFEYDKYLFIIEEATERSIEKIIIQMRKKRKISGKA